jgi:hypothetical protein
MVAMSARIISRMARPAASSAALLIRRPEESLWTLVDNRLSTAIVRKYLSCKYEYLAWKDPPVQPPWTTAA